ncbi:MAG: hypothetical protein AABX93_01650 [Nanoarchaeota archaeon]
MDILFIFGAAFFLFVAFKVLMMELHIAAKIVSVGFIFILLTGTYVYFQSDSNIGNPDGAVDFTKTYMLWFSEVIPAKSPSGYVSKIENETGIKIKS